MRPIKSGNGGAACSLSIQVWLDVCVCLQHHLADIYGCVSDYTAEDLFVCVCVRMCEGVMTEGVCVGLWEHLWSVVMWEFTTVCNVFCECFCVCSIFLIQRWLSILDSWHAFTCFYDNRTSQQYLRRQILTIIVW